jgi:hypothetical protein
MKRRFILETSELRIYCSINLLKSILSTYKTPALWFITSAVMRFYTGTIVNALALNPWDAGTGRLNWPTHQTSCYTGIEY